MKEEEKQQPTRTLLTTNFPRGTSHDSILALCKAEGAVREHFVMHSKYSVFFVGFYDLRASEMAYKKLQSEEIGGKRLAVKYTIGRAEVPRGNDACDETKGQGTVIVEKASERAEKILREEGDLKDLESRHGGLVANFYDSRRAASAVSRLRREGETEARIAWDHDLRRRREMFSEAEEVVKNAMHGYFKGVSSSDDPREKRPGPGPTEQRKRPRTETNWMVSLFDRFIKENSREIARELANAP